MTRRAFLLAASGAAAPAGFARRLDTLRERYAIPGLSAAILRRGQAAWTAAFGFQDLERRIAATPATPYRIASLTKTFASTLLMQLYEQGKLDLEQPIREYLPPGSRLAAELDRPAIRIRHVFSHTSEGTPPGENYRYSGARYAALTYVIDKLAGVPFRELLARNILDKLGMRRSVPGQDATDERYQPLLEQLAKPYQLEGGRTVLSEYPPRRISAAAGLISTVEDLARYDAAIDRHVLLRRETQEKAWTPAVSGSGRTLPYGLGWFIQRRGGERLIWHYGYWPGSFSALYLKVPARHVTLFLLANSDGLSRPFDSLGKGDVTGSAFAMLFLEAERV